ncbi:unnamed protein product [Owenia fusiformis]|uniref:Uncharacterized protein n=1 Tax=Owenia fusiformis TaxID=6347 RepID=A0A8J1Y3P1_OWEFU|nr:unnamed protein product [Owenia fusiformis]
MALSKGVFIVAAKRTPFGAFGGKLKDFTAVDLGAIAAGAALKAGGINPEIIDTCVVGSVGQNSPDAAYLGRHVALRNGVPVSTPCLTVNRLCGSGFQAIVSATQDILTNDANVGIAGGSEHMSGAPFTLRGARFGTKLGQDLKLEDTLWATLTDLHIKTPMGITAENLAEKYNISREECDTFALQSQSRWKAAQDGGRFKEEMAPITIKSRKGEVVFEVDEHPKPETTMAQISKLPPVFKKGGTVNAGNASGICDGAGAVIVASEDAVKQHNLTPLVRIVGYHISGCDPSIMGIGPVPAITNLLQKTGKTLAEIDLVEINEAFAPQTIACAKELGIDMSKLNVNGGAIALGHPVGCSGSRITAHLVAELKRTASKYAIGSACIGGGQGIALLFENLQ